MDDTPPAISAVEVAFSKKKKGYSSHQLLWPDFAKRYGLAPAIVLGVIYWYSALSDKAIKKLKEKMKEKHGDDYYDDVPPGIAFLKPRISYTELAKRTGLPRSTIVRAVERIADRKGFKVTNEGNGVNQFDLGCMELDDVWETTDGGMKTALKLSVEEIKVFGPSAAVLLSQIRMRTSTLSKHGAQTWFNAEHCQFHINRFMPKRTRNYVLEALQECGVLIRKEGKRREYRINQTVLESRINEYYQVGKNGPEVGKNGPPLILDEQKWTTLCV